MKRLIVEEVHAFRAEVRAQARAAGQIRRQERFVKRDVERNFLIYRQPSYAYPR